MQKTTPPTLPPLLTLPLFFSLPLTLCLSPFLSRCLMWECIAVFQYICTFRFLANNVCSYFSLSPPLLSHSLPLLCHEWVCITAFECTRCFWSVILTALNSYLFSGLLNCFGVPVRSDASLPELQLSYCWSALLCFWLSAFLCFLWFLLLFLLIILYHPPYAGRMASFTPVWSHWVTV